MILDPSKVALSFVVAALILVGGSTVISQRQTEVAFKDLPQIVANSQDFEQDYRVNQYAQASSDDNSTQNHEQNSPNNAKMEVEVMTASIESSNPATTDDWSLEKISDHTLEITR